MKSLLVLIFMIGFSSAQSADRLFEKEFELSRNEYGYSLFTCQLAIRNLLKEIHMQEDLIKKARGEILRIKMGNCNSFKFENDNMTHARVKAIIQYSIPESKLDSLSIVNEELPISLRQYRYVNKYDQ